ncbi:DNA sulfur modification protein DndB [Cytobacillus gottheilii]|uniref:DNA sulfur modification protein DndB n=1 Tax=Cytobacillus gottheilii TaxID=859144 RepID=UPI0009BB4A21|nr:DNA sulfur modification protein DndB [Cytobacillus gottheilii]
MLQDRELLEQNLIKPTLEIKRKRKVVREIKDNLATSHAIYDGTVQEWINNPAEELSGLDERLLYLFAEQVFNETKDLSVDPEEFFTEYEIKTAKQYSGKMFIKDDLKLPITFEPPVIEYSHNVWTMRIHIKLLVDMLKSKLLNWNPESQREATYRRVNGEMVEEATVYLDNVIEMKNLIKVNKLEITQIILNASAGSADNGEEVTYNSDTYELQVNKGTKLDVVDGYHRILAAARAMDEKPNIDMYFDLKLLNMTVDRAAAYLAQISKGERISETKRKIMSKDTDAIKVVEELNSRSELAGRISKKEGLTPSIGEIVTYNTLLNSIEKNFEFKNKKDMYDVSDYLTEFFDVFLSYYEEEFNEKYQETKKVSLINSNFMFSGYVRLASRMMEEEIDSRDVRKYINKINFNKDNPEWKQRGILDNKGNLTRGSVKFIENYFDEINL